MEASFNYITNSLNISKKVAEICSRSGNNESDINHYMNISKYKKQLSKLDKEQVRKELREYGAWDDEDLKDNEENLTRLFWVVCGNIADK